MEYCFEKIWPAGVHSGLLGKENMGSPLLRFVNYKKEKDFLTSKF